MFKNLKKLKKLLDNYDKIMVMIESEHVKKPKNTRYSTLNTPQTQLEEIYKLEKGGK